METLLRKVKIAGRLEKAMKHFVKETGVAEVVNMKIEWPLKVV